jgi:hypothetical protein
MNLHEVTPQAEVGISAVHVGTADRNEVARLVTQPHAVLREAGLNAGAETQVRVRVEEDFLRPTEGGDTVIIIIWPDGSITVIVIHHTFL